MATVVVMVSPNEESGTALHLIYVYDEQEYMLEDSRARLGTLRDRPTEVKTTLEHCTA